MQSPGPTPPPALAIQLWFAAPTLVQAALTAHLEARGCFQPDLPASLWPPTQASHMAAGGIRSVILTKLLP